MAIKKYPEKIREGVCSLAGFQFLSKSKVVWLPIVFYLAKNQTPYPPGHCENILSNENINL